MKVDVNIECPTCMARIKRLRVDGKDDWVPMDIKSHPGCILSKSVDEIIAILLETDEYKVSEEIKLQLEQLKELRVAR